MNIQEIDKWLDEEYGCSYTKLEELHDFLVEQDMKHQDQAKKETERLNNIIKKLEEANKILSKEITKGNVVGQGMITECCGIPLGDIPKLIEYKKRNKNAIDCLNGILTEAYLDESNDVDIGLVEYAVSLLLGEK